jgi:phage protein D
MKSRRVSIKLMYEGANITDDITSDLQSFTYNDNASGSSDDVTIELKDDSGKWISSWAPTKGDIIQPTIITENWRYEGDVQSVECGIFIIDEPSYSGRPRVFSIGAVSSPINKGFIDVPNSLTKQNATIRDIADTIVRSYRNKDSNSDSDSEFELDFSSSANPVIDYVEQSEQTDAAFLFELCQKNGLAMKIFKKRIVIFNENKYEANASTATLTESDLISWTAKTSFTNTGFDGCQIAYTVPNTATTFFHTFKPSTKTGNKIYKMNEVVSSLAEAERYAKCKLREMNKRESILNLEMPGNLEMFASNVVTIEDLGIFNGKYYIDKVSHKISSGFTTSLELHKCLVGY